MVVVRLHAEGKRFQNAVLRGSAPPARAEGEVAKGCLGLPDSGARNETLTVKCRTFSHLNSVRAEVHRRRSANCAEVVQMEWNLDLATNFHRDLVSPEWLEDLNRHLEDHPSLRAKQLRPTLRSPYSEERFMGPESVAKYRFEVQLEWTQESPLRIEYSFFLEFRPVENSFKELEVATRFSWKYEACHNGQDLTEAGVAEESDVESLEIIDQPLLQDIGTRFSLVPVGICENVVKLAFNDPSRLPLLTETYPGYLYQLEWVARPAAMARLFKRFAKVSSVGDGVTLGGLPRYSSPEGLDG